MIRLVCFGRRINWIVFVYQVMYYLTFSVPDRNTRIILIYNASNIGRNDWMAYVSSDIWIDTDIKSYLLKRKNMIRS